MHKMKDRFRKELKDRRNGLLKIDVLDKSNIIKEKLFSLKEFKQAQIVLFYISYDNEVFTHDMIKESFSQGKHIAVPISDKKNRCLILSEFDKWDDLEIGSYGILEPRKDKIKEIPASKVDLIIVPGVGFDKHGRRIGHGKGYYDNLLRDSTNSVNIGLAFEIQIVDEIPVESHDIPVDIIITEERIISRL